MSNPADVPVSAEAPAFISGQESSATAPAESSAAETRKRGDLITGYQCIRKPLWPNLPMPKTHLYIRPASGLRHLKSDACVRILSIWSRSPQAAYRS